MTSWCGIDGKHYLFDVWYPMDPYPFVTHGKSMLPVSIASPLTAMMFLLKSGREVKWTPWTSSEDATHFCIKAFDWYEI